MIVMLEYRRAGKQHAFRWHSVLVLATWLAWYRGRPFEPTRYAIRFASASTARR